MSSELKKVVGGCEDVARFGDALQAGDVNLDQALAKVGTPSEAPSGLAGLSGELDKLKIASESVGRIVPVARRRLRKSAEIARKADRDCYSFNCIWNDMMS